MWALFGVTVSILFYAWMDNVVQIFKINFQASILPCIEWLSFSIAIFVPNDQDQGSVSQEFLLVFGCPQFPRCIISYELVYTRLM